MGLKSEDIAIVESRHSTATVLGAGATFTGTGAIDMTTLAGITVTVFADQAGTLYIDGSTDGSNNWGDYSKSVAVSASTQAELRVSVPTAFARVRYVNGGTIQTVMRLQTTLRKEGGVGTGVAAPNGDALATQTTLDAFKTANHTDLGTAITRLTSILAALPAALAANGGLKIEGVASGVPVPASLSATDAGIAALRSYKGAIDITSSLSDGSDLAHQAVGLIVDTDSTLKFNTTGYDGTGTTTLTSVAAKAWVPIPLPIKRVFSTGTTLGGNIYAVY